MKFDPVLEEAQLLRRYKRFLADVRRENGESITIHCPNTGSMKACIVENAPCWLSDSGNPKRKYRHTWEIATTQTGHLAGINTHRANGLVVEAINEGVITELQGYEQLDKEQKYGEEGSRIDILLSSPENKRLPSLCYVEVKSVTLSEPLTPEGLGTFPDAVSVRGTKHLRELIWCVEQGHRAVLLFCVQHTGIDRVAPADHIDPLYGKTLRLALKAGVEVYAYGADISPEAIRLVRSLPVQADENVTAVFT